MCLQHTAFSASRVIHGTQVPSCEQLRQRINYGSFKDIDKLLSALSASEGLFNSRTVYRVPSNVANAQEHPQERESDVE